MMVYSSQLYFHEYHYVCVFKNVDLFCVGITLYARVTFYLLTL